MRLDVKICGLRTSAAIEAALVSGASHIGFIFFEKSPRNVTAKQAADLRKAAAGKARVVAVTVDASDAALDAIVATAAPDMLQLHGSESPGRVTEVKLRYGLPVMKALPIRDDTDLAPIAEFAGAADRLLFDAKPPRDAAVPGGRGVSFDWNLLVDLDRTIDYMLSGGLHAGNIARALAILSPGGIDISSGVESAPGEKSPELISQFFAALAAAAPDWRRGNRDR